MWHTDEYMCFGCELSMKLYLSVRCCVCIWQCTWWGDSKQGNTLMGINIRFFFSLHRKINRKARSESKSEGEKANDASNSSPKNRRRRGAKKLLRTSFPLTSHNLRSKCQLVGSDRPIVPMIYSGRDRNRAQSLCDRLCTMAPPHMH